MSKEMKKQMPPKRKFDKNVFVRVVKSLVKAYPVLIPITAACVIFSALVSAIPAIFTQKIFDIIGASIKEVFS